MYIKVSTFNFIIDTFILYLHVFDATTLKITHTFYFDSLQKVHTFQKSLEAVLQRLAEAEIGQNTVTNAGSIAGTESEILFFRNQLKVS